MPGKKKKSDKQLMELVALMSVAPRPRAGARRKKGSGMCCKGKGVPSLDSMIYNSYGSA